MATKPANMLYLAEDVPPLAVVIVNALQYVAVTSSFLVLPLIVAREANMSPVAADSMLSWAMIVLALGTALQAVHRGPIGSGYLAPSVMTAIFLGPSVEAVRIGGLALMSGMTLFSGAVQSVFSKSLYRFRTVLPPELAGVVIFLVGVSNGVVGLRYLLSPDAATLPGGAHWIVAAVTMGVMVAANVWSRGVLGLSCALFGMIAGYAVAIPLGVLPWDSLTALSTLPAVALPGVSQIGWSFDATLILPFFIAAIANGMKAVALLTASQRMLDADWTRPDMKPIGRGVLADGLTVMAAGAVSVFAVNVSASSVGLTAATGVASRRVAYVTALIFILLAFLPLFTRLLVLIPAPVVGATLVFTSCSVLKNGIEAIAARMYDTRKTLVVGLSVMAGVAVEAFPHSFRLMPPWLHPITVSALVFGATVGFLLTLFFRIGQRRTTTMTVTQDAPDSASLALFIDRCGASWGARRDVVTRAERAVQELSEAVRGYCQPQGPMTLSVAFDEFRLDIDMRYKGILLPMVRDRPSLGEIIESEDGARKLAAFLLRHYATRVTSTERDGDCTVRLHFDH